MSTKLHALRKLRVVSPEAMTRADAIAVRMGTSLDALIADAAHAIVRHLGERVGSGPVAVLAGPGNNGADGVVAARLMRQAGAAVELFALGRGEPECRTLADFDPASFVVVVDALFGGGLSRDLTGEAAEAVRRLNEASCFVLSVDLPSGVDGASGTERGICVRADETLTFLRHRPGHLLMPGRAYCGHVTVASIAMPEDALAEALRDAAPLWQNDPALWQGSLRVPTVNGHKFDRGHAAVLGGGASHTGAARMTALAALRAGAGLVTLLSPGSALLVNAAHLTAVMLRRCNDAVELGAILTDPRINALALGPGFGIGEGARAAAVAILSTNRQLVLDADGLTSFQERPGELFDAIGGEGQCVLTPHDGEFARLFPDLASDASLPKHERARQAAARSGAAVILKGADTVIAAPDGRAAINANGTPWLATAGSGDVLGGIVLGHLAAGMPLFEAACAGVWMHGRAAELFGPGLIAEDLPGLLPAVWRELA